VDDHERSGIVTDSRLSISARTEGPIVRAVGRAPFTVRTKLLFAFAVIAALLVGLGVLGLRVLGQSSARIESLGTLQLRAATYRSLQTQASQIRQGLAIRTAEDPSLARYLGGIAPALLNGHSWTLVDTTITASVSQLGPATNESRLGFVPPPQDEVLLKRIRRDYTQFKAGLRRMTTLDRAGTTSRQIQPILTRVIDIDNDLSDLTDRLATRTRAETDAVIAQNKSSYASSRNLFIAVGSISVLLALLLGVVIARSLIGPLKRTEARLAEIAAGDFSRHVEVQNRDELGQLAVNLNRMNDELRRLYGELETASKHKSELLANMSHELRTPMNAIIGFSELLQQRLAGDLNEQQLGYVEDVLAAGRHLLALINDMLDLSKVEAGRMELELDDVSLREVFESGLTMHAERAAVGRVALGMRLEPNEIIVRGDERKLRQVVFNLLSNAVNFTPAGGRVEVTASIPNGVVEVTVSDTGPGIAADDQELIFEEFRQARDGGGRHQGTGLGLPLSRKLIELHGGRLWVESVLGQGSTFRFTLPVDPD
jgi:signal transduction histidine kinase